MRKGDCQQQQALLPGGFLLSQASIRSVEGFGFEICLLNSETSCRLVSTPGHEALSDSLFHPHSQSRKNSQSDPGDFLALSLGPTEHTNTGKSGLSTSAQGYKCDSRATLPYRVLTGLTEKGSAWAPPGAGST